jgi:hypothetical protein
MTDDELAELQDQFKRLHTRLTDERAPDDRAA